ncbi:MAG: sigma-54 dependent transcriptional regulator [Undibacterium sp.]|nr:sigma-54 dependent transcriptional regulator [Undibacterium sp.]
MIVSDKEANRTPRILVIDDEAHLRELLEITLIKMGLDVDTAENLQAARRLLAKQSYSLILTDMRLPDGSGLEIVDEVNEQYKHIPIAVITAFGSTDNAVVALKAGAFDYLTKPVALDQLRKLVRAALQLHSTKANEEVSLVPAQPSSPSFLIGQSPEIVHVRTQIGRLARSMAPVMITGESGSGKELAAREIHRNSTRFDKPFIAVNCGAIPEMLMEAEFFGYRKGAFTGANEDRDGFFQAANGGTLMLDEVADLPLAMQVKLLRAIQERRVRKVGATAEEAVDVRILSATHQNLADCVANGKFRQDLFYRLNVIELILPPLRQRLSDLADLAACILLKLGNPAYPLSLQSEALQALQQYDFPGNVRELENILERAAAFADDGCIAVIDLALRSNVVARAPEMLMQSERSNELASDAQLVDASMAEKSPAIIVNTSDVFKAPNLPCSLPTYLELVESEVIRRALKQTRNNRTQAAVLLGVSFRQLRYSIQKLKIDDVES